MCDVCIIGAGPIGIEIAIELERRGTRTRILEAGVLGSTINWYAPGTHFFSSPERIALAGVPLMTQLQTKATREEYLLYLRSLVSQFDLDISYGRKATKVEPSNSGSLLVHYDHLLGRTSVESEHLEVEKVILAVGDMHKPRLLGIPGEELTHASHYLEEPHRYFGKDVLIVGGKNSAIEAAIRLFRLGAKVTLSYRGAELDQKRIKYWLYPEIQFLIKRKSIDFLPESNLTKITTESASLSQGSESLTVKPDEILLLTGYEQDKSLFENSGIALTGEALKPKHSPKTHETNISGIYVAGTAVAGTQSGGVTEFIETSHEHVRRIVTHICGEDSWERENRSFKSDPEFLEN